MNFRLIFKNFSSISAGLVIYTFLSNIVIGYEYALGAFSLFLGYSLAFYVSENLIKKKKFKQAVSLSFILALTYLMNVPTIYNMQYDYKLQQTNYENNLNKIEEYKSKIKNTLDKSELKLKLKSLENKLSAIKYSFNDKYLAIKSKITEEYLYHKKIKDYSKWWGKYSLKSNCSNVKAIRSVRIECLTQFELSKISGNTIKNLELKIINIKNNIENLEDKNNKIKADNAFYNTEIAKLKQENKELMQNIEVTPKWLLYVFMLIFGLFMEGIVVFDLYLERIGDELEDDMYDYFTSYLKNRNVPLHDLSLWKYGKYKGKKPMALANSYIGAILYCYLYDINFKDLKPEYILKINGRDGIEFTNGKKRIKLINRFYSPKHKQYFKCLGSTTETLKIKNKTINPQIETINFLLKNFNVDFYMISVEEIENGLTTFLRQFYKKH